MTQVQDASRTTIHEVAVGVPAKRVYALLADLGNWPRIFRPFVHLEVLGSAGDFQRVGMWSVTGDRVEHWSALRRPDEAALRIDFRPEEVAPPLTRMERSWTVEPRGSGACVVRLAHTYAVADDDPAAAASVRAAVDTVAQAETAAVKAAAEIEAGASDLLLTVTDRVDIDAPVEAVHDALYAVERWPEFLPHVVRVDVRQDSAGMQMVEMDTREGDGSLLTLRTARVGRPPLTICFKQLALPPIGSSHHVRWTLTPSGAGRGVSVTSEQVVVIDESGIPQLPGEGRPVDKARQFAQRELSAKARLILDGVKGRLESR